MVETNHVQLDDELWERINALTDGAAAVCFQCGECTAVCPWGLVREGALNVRSMMRQAQLGVKLWDDDLWLCSSCAQCEAYCPRAVEIADVFRALRGIGWQERTVEPGLPSMLWSIYWNENPWSQPPSQRFSWAKDLEVPIFDPQRHEAALYVGCTASYDRRVQRVAAALVRVLGSCGAKFGCLGDREPCCGEPVKSVGHNPYFEEVVHSSARVFRDMGVQKLVTISPHCYDVFKNDYPEVLGGGFIETMHYTQYLSELIHNGQLDLTPGVLNGEIKEGIGKQLREMVEVTFQDPCYLGRSNGEYAAPRYVLGALPGMVLLEMEDKEVDGLCCGGGGGRMWLETPPGERFADLRVQQAADTGASILATACPFCLVCLEDSLKAAGDLDMRVLDVAEIVWESMEDNFK